MKYDCFTTGSTMKPVRLVFFETGKILHLASIGEAAKHLGVTKEYVRNYLKKGYCMRKHGCYIYDDTEYTKKNRLEPLD